MGVRLIRRTVPRGAGSIAIALLGVVLGGCGRTDRNPLASNGGVPSIAGTNAAGGAAGSVGAGGTATPPLGGAATGGSGQPCEGSQAPNPATAAFARLSNVELNNSVRALLPEGTSGSGLPWLSEAEGLASWSTTLLAVQGMPDLAHAVGLLLTDNDAEGWLAGCDVAVEGEETCRDVLAEAFVERAYRRPLQHADRLEIAEAFTRGRTMGGGDFKSGMRTVVETALRSPQFAYLLEPGGEEVREGVVELTSYESAARLSYFLTAAPPDAELWRAAKENRLGPEQLGEHAERLLDSPAARQQLSRYYLQRMSAIPQEVPELGLDAALTAAVAESSLRFVEEVFFSGTGTFRELITEPSAWTNGALAAYYDFPASGADWQKVKLDPTKWGGLFTQPAFLARNPHGTFLVYRSVPVLRQVLCYDVPPPPPDVMVDPTYQPPPNATARQLLEDQTRGVDCMECHQYINAVGFTFGHYDAVGRWSDTDHGKPVDSTGTLDRTDVAGTFSDAVGLMQSIAESQEAKSCFVRSWLQRAQRSPYEPVNACMLDALTRSFVEGDGNILDLLRGVAKSDALRYRVKTARPTGER